MRVIKLLPVLLVSALASLPAAAATSAPVDPLIEGAKLCTRLLPQYEKQYGIPKHLLSAISSTESGRYHKDLKIQIPWPWTINAEGKGYFFDNKQQAIAMVKKLRKQGMQSIDVGCMQVNLHHHPEAFASLDEAFDPKQNIEYAANFLRTLYNEGGSWKQAAADYHSKTPSRGSKYVGRVYSSWSQLVEKLRLAQSVVPQSTLNEMKRMKPTASGVQYASAAAANAKSAKRVPSSASAAKKPEVYRSPRMNSIEVNSRREERRDRDILVVRPEVRAAAMPEAGIIRVNEEIPVPSGIKTGPNFIFSN